MSKVCAILFSGGLDSSLTVCKMIERGYSPHLLHYDQGALLSNNLFEIRYQEFLSVYPDCTINFCKMNIAGLFRKIALTSLEEDILRYKVSLVCLGCKLAMHIRTIIYSTLNSINIVADGSAYRQQRYSEQRKPALEFIRRLYHKYDMEYVNPIYDLDKKTIKYGLFDRGITIQPLEDTCLFSHTFSIATDDVINEYLIDKSDVCYELIERGLSYEKNR